MNDSFFITFNAQVTVEQEIIILMHNGKPIVSKEELVEGLEKNYFYTSLNHQQNPYIIRILEGGDIQNIAIIKNSRACTEEESHYNDFELTDDEESTTPP
jgi:hypothetical protein